MISDQMFGFSSRANSRTIYDDFVRHVRQISRADLPHAGAAHAPAAVKKTADVEVTDANGADSAPAVAASDDDGGDDDGEPARRRHNNITPALLRGAEVSIYCGLCRSRIYALLTEGKFPKPVRLGKSVRWLRTEIDAWIQAHADNRVEA